MKKVKKSTGRYVIIEDGKFPYKTILSCINQSPTPVTTLEISNLTGLAQSDIRRTMMSISVRGMCQSNLIKVRASNGKKYIRTRYGPVSDEVKYTLIKQVGDGKSYETI